MKVTDSNIKGVLLDFLRFSIYQVENDKCSFEQMKSLAETIMNDLKVMASVDDIAEFYGQSRSNVSNVLSRHLIPKRDRERVTRYNLAYFIKQMPSSWLSHLKR